MVLLDSGLNGMSSSSNADTPSVTGNAVYAQWFQTKVIVDIAEETGNVVRWEDYISDVFRQCPANAVEDGSNKG
jgi:glutamine cyclotransferase